MLSAILIAMIAYSPISELYNYSNKPCLVKAKHLGYLNDPTMLTISSQIPFLSGSRMGRCDFDLCHRHATFQVSNSYMNNRIIENKFCIYSTYSHDYAKAKGLDCIQCNRPLYIVRNKQFANQVEIYMWVRARGNYLCAVTDPSELYKIDPLYDSLLQEFDDREGFLYNKRTGVAPSKEDLAKFDSYDRLSPDDKLIAQYLAGGSYADLTLLNTLSSGKNIKTVCNAIDKLINCVGIITAYQFIIFDSIMLHSHVRRRSDGEFWNMSADRCLYYQKFFLKALNRGSREPLFQHLFRQVGFDFLHLIIAEALTTNIVTDPEIILYICSYLIRDYSAGQYDFVSGKLMSTAEWQIWYKKIFLPQVKSKASGSALREIIKFESDIFKRRP